MENKVRDMRKAAGMTQSELAEHCGCARETVGNIEAGRYSVSLELADKLALFLECTVYDLFPSLLTRHMYAAKIENSRHDGFSEAMMTVYKCVENEQFSVVTLDGEVI